MHILFRKVRLSIASLAICGAFMATFAIMPLSAHAVTCTFSRHLGVGSAGSDVQCLQAWLAGQGYFTGTQTGYFGAITMSSVARWQAANGMSPTGYFLYQSLAGVGSVYQPTYAPSVPTYDPYGNGSQQDALNELQDAISANGDAIDDLRDDNNDSRAEDARDDLDDSHQYMLEALQAFVRGDYSQAQDRAQDAQNAAEDASDELDGDHHSDNDNDDDHDRDDAQSAIRDAQSAISDARYDINHSNAGSNRINKAREYLNDAQDSLNDATDSYRDEEYDDAVDYAEDAIDSADDARDEVNN